MCDNPRSGILHWFWELTITEPAVPKTLRLDLRTGKAFPAEAVLLTEIAVQFEPEVGSELAFAMLSIDGQGQCRCALELSVRQAPTKPVRQTLCAPLACFPADIGAAADTGVMAQMMKHGILVLDGGELSIQLRGEVLVPTRVQLRGLLREAKQA